MNLSSQLKELPLEIQVLYRLSAASPLTGIYYKPLDNSEIVFFGIRIKAADWHRALQELARQGLAERIRTPLVENDRQTFKIANKSRTRYRTTKEGRELLKKLGVPKSWSA